MEERVSGFTVSGDWGEIVEHGERITRALREVLEADGAPAVRNGVQSRDADALEEAFEQWNEWRPKSHELLGREIREKTARHASVGEGAGEQAGESVNDDLQTAGEELAESYRKLESDDPGGAVEKWQDSLGYVARAADSASRKALRSVEDAVYRRVMTQVAPYYFDNELISANIQRSRGNGEPFTLEVNVNDDGVKAAVGEHLAEYEDDVKRWHVAAEKDTSAAEAAEGVEAPEPNAEEFDERTT